MSPSGAPTLEADKLSITVLLGLYNGETYLRAQLDSIAAQTLPPTCILISDDGSTDGSLEIVEDFAVNWDGVVQVIEGPGQGFAANFLHLIRECAPCDMVAFSDQDDIWLPEKLAAQWARLAKADAAALHGSCTWITDENLNIRQVSVYRDVGPSFPHALVQNLAGANTLALNNAGLALAKGAAKDTTQIVAHDWWLYQLVLGLGGEVLYDRTPLVKYRQHSGNLMGQNTSLAAIAARAFEVFTGTYKDWMATNIAALEVMRDQLTPTAAAQLDMLREARKAPLMRRIKLMRALGVRKQGLVGQASLWAAILFGKI